MAAIVVPFRGSRAKRRLDGVSDGARAALALAMLGDVLAACVPVGRTLLVTDDELAAELARELGAETIADPGAGQGPGVEAGLAAVAGEAVLVVNADLPCVVPHDIRALAKAVPPGGIAVVAARDGTTNALGLTTPSLFAPLYGPGSAERFHQRAAELGRDAVATVIPALVDDVDTLADLQRISLRAGPRTQAAIATLGIAA